ncbi:MAG: AAA family ATPase, partial [Clostridiales bacterium]|nr:AAA family ATPase [Clostridiales bacterium]
IGENDSGKTAVIDALKLVLLTQSNDYVRPSEEDFYLGADNRYVDEFRIECVLSDFVPNEAKNFIEYLELSKYAEGLHYSMHLFYRAWKEKNRIFSDLRVNDPDEGIALDSRARELLKTVYLRPLRDAEREMHSGRNSRLSQILMSHKVFQDRENHTLLQILKNANRDIETYFTQQEGKEILQIIRNNLTEFHDKTLNGDASLTASDVQLKSILESLSLNAPEIHPGLGELNLVFIAAELLLLKQDDIGGLKLALIEELEAHLHPQAQLRLISYLQKEYDQSGAQIIISTHSTILASKINLKNIVLLKGGCGYDLSEGNTGLEKGDYLFLQRFLDTTKANLFFAKGVIMVEGDAENILIPVIAEIVGYPLEKYGVSIVNVGSTAFLRYSRIFIRGDQEHTIDIPVSVITDCDIKPWDESEDEDGHKIKVFCDKPVESEDAVTKKQAKYAKGSIQGFISPRWTLEYCIALSFLKDDFHHAINYGKKIKNSDKYTLTAEKITAADQETTEQQSRWNQCSETERAYKVYDLMLDGSGKSGLKSIVAQCLSSILRMAFLTEPVDKEKMFDLDLYQHTVDEGKRVELKQKFENDPYLKYLVDAIKHAVGVDHQSLQPEDNTDASN